MRKKRLRTQESVECVRKADVLRGAGGRWREKVRDREREGEKRRQNRQACECVREINRDGANRRSRRV